MIGSSSTTPERRVWSVGDAVWFDRHAGKARSLLQAGLIVEVRRPSHFPPPPPGTASSTATATSTSASASASFAAAEGSKSRPSTPALGSTSTLDAGLDGDCKIMLLEGSTSEQLSVYSVQPMPAIVSGRTARLLI